MVDTLYISAISNYHSSINVIFRQKEELEEKNEQLESLRSKNMEETLAFRNRKELFDEEYLLSYQSSRSELQHKAELRQKIQSQLEPIASSTISMPQIVKMKENFEPVSSAEKGAVDLLRQELSDLQAQLLQQRAASKRHRSHQSSSSEEDVEKSSRNIQDDANDDTDSTETRKLGFKTLNHQCKCKLFG